MCQIYCKRSQLLQIANQEHWPVLYQHQMSLPANELTHTYRWVQCNIGPQCKSQQTEGSSLPCKGVSHPESTSAGGGRIADDTHAPHSNSQRSEHTDTHSKNQCISLSIDLIMLYELVKQNSSKLRQLLGACTNLQKQGLARSLILQNILRGGR